MFTLKQFFMGNPPDPSLNTFPVYEGPPAPPKRPRSQLNEAVRLLRDLADLQNGAPLVKYEKEWNATMEEVYSFLNEVENKQS